MSQRKKMRAYLNQRAAGNARFTRRVTTMAVWRAVLTAHYRSAPPAWLIIDALSKHTGETQ